MAGAGNRYRHAVALAATGFLLAGCTAVTGGTAQPSEGLPLKPLTGSQLDDVLPTDDQIADFLGDRLAPDPDGHALSGGVSDMADGLSSEAQASPHECVAATSPLQRSIYQDTDLTDFTSFEWRLPDSRNGDVLGTTTGVAAFPTAATANDVFEMFTEQSEAWDGIVVEVPTADGDYFTDEVADVVV
ncbi:MAG TPA: sensor domain-containing protein, partial [Mycobacterium sp.]|nr:sensor domain-containing protein [Mycobacterium sp.]